MRHNITNIIKVSVLALVLSFGLSYVYAWTAPTVAAPGGNVAAPINTSATAQTKAGNLTISGILNAVGLQLPAGAGAGKVLTSDASGMATWQPSSAGWTCTGSIFCNSVHGSYSFPTTATNWTVPAGVTALRVAMKGGNAAGGTGGTGSFLKRNGTLVMVSGGGGGAGLWDGGWGGAGGGGVDGAPGGAGSGFNSGGAGGWGAGGAGGGDACGAYGAHAGGVFPNNGTNGVGGYFWYGAPVYGGHGGGASQEDFAGGSGATGAGSGGGGYGGGGGGSGYWCGYNYHGAGGGGGGYRSSVLSKDVVNDIYYVFTVAPGDTIRAAAGNWSGYVTITW